MSVAWIIPVGAILLSLGGLLVFPVALTLVSSPLYMFLLNHACSGCIMLYMNATNHAASAFLLISSWISYLAFAQLFTVRLALDALGVTLELSLVRAFFVPCASVHCGCSQNWILGGRVALLLSIHPCCC